MGAFNSFEMNFIQICPFIFFVSLFYYFSQLLLTYVYILNSSIFSRCRAVTVENQHFVFDPMNNEICVQLRVSVPLLNWSLLYSVTIVLNKKNDKKL